MRGKRLLSFWNKSSAKHAIIRLIAVISTPRHKRIGQWGECVATRYLKKRSLFTLQRNWKSGLLEADLIAIDRRILTVVEVKTRHRSLKQNYPAFNAITPIKRQRLHRLARNFLRNYGPFCRRHGIKAYRVDVVEVYYTSTRFGFRRATDIEWYKGISETHSY